MLKKDSRVSQTRKHTRTSFEREVGRVIILFSYQTPIAVYDMVTGTLHTSTKEWSHTSKCHLGKFRKECNAEREMRVGHWELEEKIYTYLLRRAKRFKDSDEDEVTRTPTDFSADDSPVTPEQVLEHDWDDEDEAAVASVEEDISKAASRAAEKQAVYDIDDESPESVVRRLAKLESAVFSSRPKRKSKKVR